MQLAVLLRRHGGKPIAAGWDGDRFAVFDTKDGKLAVVWLTTWDTEDDARDFARQYTRFQTTKMGKGVVSPDEFPDAIRRTHDADVIYARRATGQGRRGRRRLRHRGDRPTPRIRVQSGQERARSDQEEVKRDFSHGWNTEEHG